MSLQQKLNTMKQESMATKSPEQVKVMLDVTEKLVNSGIADRAIKVGETWPDFSLPDDKEDLVNSNDLTAKGPLVVSFYRGVW